MNYKPTHILARLEIGFRTDAAHLKEWEKDLMGALQRARNFGAKHGSPDDWQTHWRARWDEVETLLGRIRIQVEEMRGAIQSARFEMALAAWKVIQSEDTKLVEALGAIREQASALSAAVRKDWNILARTFEPHLETIYACAHALRVRLELLEKHSAEDVDRLIQQTLSKLPNQTHVAGMDAETYQQEYDKAAIELEQEQHEYLGFADLFKSFWQWFESPEERVTKNRSLLVDEAEDRSALSIAG